MAGIGPIDAGIADHPAAALSQADTLDRIAVISFGLFWLVWFALLFNAVLRFPDFAHGDAISDVSVWNSGKGNRGWRATSGEVAGNFTTYYYRLACAGLREYRRELAGEPPT